MLLIVVLMIWTHLSSSQLSQPCFFNSMCSCRYANSSAYIRDVSCVGVPFYKLPDLPHSHISHLDVVGAGLETVDDSLAGQVETLRLITNSIISISERTFASMTSSLRSLDLSQNQLEAAPMQALCYLKALNWLNLHGNRIPSLDSADWCYLKDTLDSLFLGENELEDLPKGSLESLRSLTWLSLDHNLLRNLETSYLPESLQTLSVQHNYLEQVPVMEPLTELDRLSLRGNLLKNAPEHSLIRRKPLAKLDLGDNCISDFHHLFNRSVIVRDITLDLNQIRTLRDNAFLGTSAGRIILAYNRIENISDDAFAGLENSLEYVDFERNLLDGFPTALSRLKKLKYLYIPSNRISDINETAFDNYARSLKAISLAGNRLRAIPQQALAKCTKLTHLNLGYNEITELTSEDFSDWGEYIDTILLQNNLIMRLESNLFKNTPHLRELSLSFNRLIDIEENAFIDVASKLESLEISFGIYRDEFPVDFLQPLISLMWLALDNNNIRLISEGSIDNLDRLQYLNLESNRLTKLPHGLLNGSIHRNLKELRLSYNHINRLSPNTFYNLMSLQTIALAGNNIRIVETSVFNNLPNLITVILSQNVIDTIKPGAFRNLPRLRKLDIQLNEIREFSLNIFDTVANNLTMTLNISRNEITDLSFNQNSRLISISTLDVSHNRISEVPSRFLQYMAHTLTRLDLGYNMIFQVHPLSFANLTLLEVLHLEHNGIVSIRRKAFSGLRNLQLLDLSHNHVKSLQVSQFTNCPNLRVVDLSFNHIRTLPRDVFQNSRIERLDLSNNEFIVFPSQAFGDIGFTLRHLDVSFNQIDRVDSTMFHETQFLTSLNLCHNKINILPDNVFTSLGNLLNLQLCKNPLTANFKELFHYVPKLRRLNLANTGLRYAPLFPLPRLTHLNLSFNNLDELPTNSVEGLSNLRSLNLRANSFTSVPSSCWPKIPLLKHLDISFNPIKMLTADSFQGIYRLDSLNMKQLYRLERFDAGSLNSLKFLTSLELQS